LPGANTLAYYENSQVTDEKSLTLSPERRLDDILDYKSFHYISSNINGGKANLNGDKTMFCVCFILLISSKMSREKSLIDLTNSSMLKTAPVNNGFSGVYNKAKIVLSVFIEYSVHTSIV